MPSEPADPPGVLPGPAITPEAVVETGRGRYLLSSDKALIQAVVVHRFLSEDSYWASGITFPVVEAAIAGSWCVGIYHDDNQVGYARLITDYATFGYLADVFVLPGHRGQGLATAMMNYIMKQTFVEQLRSVMLSTQDAQDMYTRYGFRSLDNPQAVMKRLRAGT